VAEGKCGSLCTVGDSPTSTSRVMDCHSVEKLRFQLLDRRDVTPLQGGACDVLGFFVPLGNRDFGSACTVVGYSFPHISGESGILTL
jgi:hypothetical protein